MRYLVDPTDPLSQVVAEIDAGGDIVTHYVRGDQLLGLHRPASGESRYFHLDALGSARALTDPAGTVRDRYSYRAFGEMIDHQGSDPNPYGFAGEPLDPTGFSYNRARWLDLALGRFLSVDPFQGRPMDPKSQHPYLYAHLDPINNNDPTGRSSMGLSTNFATFAIAGLIALAPGVGSKNFIPKCRKLTQGEIALAETVFHGSIKYSEVEVCKKKAYFFQPRDRPMSVRGKIFLNPKGSLYKIDYSKVSIDLQARFIHEMVHVWQHQQGIPVAFKALLNRRYSYLPIDPKMSFDDYGLEQQGDIARDYFYLLNGYNVEGAPEIEVYKEMIPFVPNH